MKFPGMISPPLASLLTNFVQLWRTVLLTFSWTITSACIFSLALMSPNPPFADSKMAGELEKIHTSLVGVIVVIVFTINSSLIAYTKTMIYLEVQKKVASANVRKGAKAFRQIGIATQVSESKRMFKSRLEPLLEVY